MSSTKYDYSKIFASGSSIGELKEMPDADYIRGWGYLGKDEAPPMEHFNHLQNLTDKKLFELLGLINNVGDSLAPIATSGSFNDLKDVVYCTEADIDAILAKEKLTDTQINTILEGWSIPSADDDKMLKESGLVD